MACHASGRMAWLSDAAEEMLSRWIDIAPQHGQALDENGRRDL